MEKKKRKQQLEVPGTERESIEEVDVAAEKYRKIRDERQALTKLETGAMEELAAVLEENNLKPGSKYEYEDDEGITREVKVTITKVKISVREKKDKPANQNDDKPEVSGD